MEKRWVHWAVVLAPIGFLALLSQLGGISVLIGAGLFGVNRVNVGKFLVSIGTVRDCSR